MEEKNLTSNEKNNSFKNYHYVKVYPSVSIAITSPKSIVKQTTKIMFSFIWDRKPDKISRTKLIRDKNNKYK